MLHQFPVFILSLVILVSPMIAIAAEHDHHANHQQSTLHLNNGKKWQTDAPLRRSMVDIRQQLSERIEAIHNKQLAVQDYHALATTIESEISTIIAECKLPPEADAQLHLVLAELISGISMMSGQQDAAQARRGAVKVISALNAYSQYFDDPGFTPFNH